MAGDFERGTPLSWGAHEGAGPLSGSWEGKFQGRAGDGVRFKSHRPLQAVIRTLLSPIPAVHGKRLSLIFSRTVLLARISPIRLRYEFISDGSASVSS